MSTTDYIVGLAFVAATLGTVVVGVVVMVVSDVRAHRRSR